MTTPYQFTNAQLFTPTSINNCTLWLDAADRNTITGTTVTSWTDKSGAGNTATATSGPSQSTYNNYPVVSFNGTSQFMVSNNTVPRTTHTLIAVHRPAVINANLQGNTSLFRYQALSTPYIVFPYMSGLVPRGYITSADGAGAGSIDAGNSTLVENSVITSFNLIIAVIQSGSQQIFRNGSLQSSTTLSLSGATSDTLTIGRYTPGLSEYYQGSLGEMIVYPYSLSITQRQQVEGYLAWKWGLQAQLPSNHPYKQTPPYRTQPFPLVPAIQQQTNKGAASDPRTISGCILWLDGADKSTMFLDSAGTLPISASGQSVSLWKDKSSSANNASNTSSQPTVNFSGQNSLSVLNFNGSQYLNLTPSLLPNGSTPFTFFILVRTTSPGVQVYFSWGSYTVNGRAPQFYLANYQLTNDLYGSAGPSDTTTYNSVYVLMSVTASTTYTAFDNGSPFTNNNISISLNTGTTYATVGVGQVGGTLTYYLTGQIAEIIGYNTVLSTSQRQQVEGYLAWKWGLTANFPADFPYKNQQLFPFPYTVNRYTNKNWIPLNVANCQVWLDAADQATIQYSTGSNVSVWRDKSGNNNTASTSTNYPTYSQSSLNRLGTLRFSGASGTPNYLDMGPFNFGTNTRSFFLVIQNTAGATGIATIPHIFFPGSPYPAVSMSIAGWFAINIQGTSTQAEYFADRNRYYIFSYTLGPPSGIAADPEKLYANGSLVHSGTTGPYANATNGYRIGWLTNGDNTNNYYFDGNIAEFLIFNTFVTDFQRQQVEGYLAWKWGLQTQLPGNHPYKLFPPSP